MKEVIFLEHSSTLIDFKSLDINKAILFDVENGATVKINGVGFKENLVSKIEIIKHKFDDECGLFIHAYAGNLQLTTTITKNDYVIEKDKTNGISYYYVRKAEDYDYAE